VHGAAAKDLLEIHGAVQELLLLAFVHETVELH